MQRKQRGVGSRPRKSSAIVAAGLAGAVAALMAGCATQTQTADCVDAQGHVMPDSYCQNTSGPYYSSYHHYHWIYGGNISSVGGYSTVRGGSVTPASGADVVSRSGASISHGGFGESGEGHGAGARGGGS